MPKSGTSTKPNTLATTVRWRVKRRRSASYALAIVMAPGRIDSTGSKCYARSCLNLRLLDREGARLQQRLPGSWETHSASVSRHPREGRLNYGLVPLSTRRARGWSLHTSV